MRRMTYRLLTSVAIGTLGLAACSDSAATSQDGNEGAVVVFAASSLTEAFTEMGAAFSAANPGFHVTFNFAGSGELVTQISEGAPADIFVAADDSNMQMITARGLNATEPVVIARNTFAIIVERGNPRGITGLADLADPDLIVVLCADTVPCGKGAATILAGAAVTVTPKSFEDKVKGVVTKVAGGEADAGIVFATDIAAAGDTADGVDIPDDVNVMSNYPIVVTTDAGNPTGAAAFIAFVSSAAGQAILAQHGFLAP